MIQALEVGLGRLVTNLRGVVVVDHLGLVRYHIVIHVLLLLHAGKLQCLAVLADIRTVLDLLSLKLAVNSKDLSTIDDNRVVFSVLLLLLV